MNDNIIIYTLSLLCVLLILFELILIKRTKGIIDSIVFAFYSLPLYWLMMFKGTGGAAFTWWFYLVIITSLQILMLIFKIAKYLIRKLRTQKN
ncbi:hypothetical protein PC1C4_14600 [Paraprevotella clara]|jgi:apolipoprotein N-acyltransferase|nr:hypothetical protein PC1C4_14600 [Paraprevotella clara]